MKFIQRFILLFLIVSLFQFLECTKNSDQNSPSKTNSDRDTRMEWWREARFGMFIHWGLYSVPAGFWQGERVNGYAEWIMNKAQIPLEDYEKSLDRVIELSKEKNSTIMFMTQPSLYKMDMTAEEDASLWMTYDFGDIYYPTETMIYAMEEFNNRLIKVCKNIKDIFCIDLEKKVPKTLDYTYDDMHFNENGARFVADEISSYMKENIPEFIQV